MLFSLTERKKNKITITVELIKYIYYLLQLFDSLCHFVKGSLHIVVYPIKNGSLYASNKEEQTVSIMKEVTAAE